MNVTVPERERGGLLAVDRPLDLDDAAIRIRGAPGNGPEAEDEAVTRFPQYGRRHRNPIDHATTEE